MPLKTLPFKAGVNRESTRYSVEGSWYECDKIRFRQSYPEKIGGWVQASAETFLGVCRSLSSWITIGGQQLRGVGTNLKFYIEKGGAFFDVTPLRDTTAAGDVTFSATNGSNVITVTDTGSDTVVGSYVTYSGAVTLGGNITADILNAEHVITEFISANSYKIIVGVTANASDTGNGGASVVGEYQINIGPAVTVPTAGWSAGPWSEGVWGTGVEGTDEIRLWNQTNFGEDLIYGPKFGGLYYWDASSGVNTRGVNIVDLPSADANVPTTHLNLLVSDISRFVFVFGCNDYGDTALDSLLIRWSDQESAVTWTPSATNQAGSIRLSRGSRIVAVMQARQEILVWTDTTLYSLQYIGAPIVWAAQVVGENISIANDRAPSYAAGVAYWMGSGVFYAYDGRVLPLVCDVRRHVFKSLNTNQYEQIFSGTNEQFHEIWWFYCGAESTTVTNYVIYNYREQIWYYGTMARTAWADDAWSGLPLAASYSMNLIVHEVGLDDAETGTAQPIEAYIDSAQFDVDDGHKFAFVWRVVPDITFEGSTANAPSANLTLTPLKGSGSGFNNPLSEGGVASQDIIRSVTVPVEEYTNQLHIRVRGRQMQLRVESNDVGVQWQLGRPRIDLRPDGRR